MSRNLRRRLLFASVSTLLLACSSQKGGTGAASSGASTSGSSTGSSSSSSGGGSSTTSSSSSGGGSSTTSSSSSGSASTSGSSSTSTSTSSSSSSSSSSSGITSSCAPSKVMLGVEAAYPSGTVDGFAVADVNKDGIPDIVASFGGDSGGVSVILNNGDGTFAMPVFYALANAGDGLVVADLSGTGAPDIVTGGDDVYLELLLNKGDGTYPQMSTISTMGGGGFEKIIAADFNGDGFVDLISSDTMDPSTVFLNLNGGKASFVGSGSKISAVTGAGMASGHLNASSTLPDLVTASAEEACVLFNTSGQFTGTPSCVMYTTGGDLNDIAVGDVNEDGLDDLLLNETVFINMGGGVFADGVPYKTPVGDTVLAVALADMNNDGHLDLVLAAYQGNVFIGLGKGDGTFETPLAGYSCGNGALNLPQLGVGDFKGNGLNGVAVPDQNNSMVDLLEATCMP